MKAFRKATVSRAAQRMKDRWDTKAYRAGINRAADALRNALNIHKRGEHVDGCKALFTKDDNDCDLCGRRGGPR